MKDCIFCEIVKQPEWIFYEDEHFIAFPDINPIVEGHTLLTTKKHREKFHGLDKDEQAGLGKALFSVCKILERFSDHINISNTSGSHASQSVPHFHFHLIPRKRGDRLWEGEKSRIVLDRSSGFERLSPGREQLLKMVQDLKKPI